jgi:hypothetical protein
VRTWDETVYAADADESGTIHKGNFPACVRICSNGVVEAVLGFVWHVGKSTA